ncbi:MAG: insulinase family protein [Holosporaceae bacterium]|jgi:predicted Zn-dependent peptidase|nr:insulinase family protein [Holosporaceae bacterium]
MAKPILTKLKNGMRVVTRNMENFDSVVLGYWIEAGGVRETEEVCGISHFLEHMAFKGTTTRDAKQIAEEIESVGGYLNAYTSKETTAYHAKILKDDVPLAMDILSDILQNPTFPEEELLRERGVIIQEIYQTQDTPDDIIFDHFQRVAFPNQSLGWPILGPIKIVSRVAATDLHSYRSKYYNADNMVLAAVGNVDHNQMVDLLSRHSAGFSNNRTSSHNCRYDYIGGAYADIRNLEQTHVIIGFNGLSSLSEDYYTLAILSSILGGGMSSRLFQEVREKRGLAYSIYSFSSSYRNNGVFGIYAATSAEKLAELAHIVAHELIKIRKDVSEKELQRTKAQFKSSLLMAEEGNTSSCEQIVNQTLIFGSPLEREEVLRKIMSVTIDCVQKIADSILSSPTSVVTVGKNDGACVLEALKSCGMAGAEG